MGAGAMLRLWIGLFLLFGALAHGNLESTDSAMTLHAARALLVRGDSGLRSSAQDPEWVGERMISDEIARSSATGQPKYGMVGRSGLHYVWFPVGHEWLMVPAIAAGEALQRALPQVEQSYRDKTARGVPGEQWHTTDYPHGQFVFDHALVAMLLPAAFGAGSILLLWWIARSLGCGGRDATIAAAAIGLCSQFFPLTRETLSDGPGLFFLLGALLGTIRWLQGGIGTRGLFLAGSAAGWAVLTRYPHALPVAVLGIAVAITALRRRQPRPLLAFVAGGLPWLVLLCTVNHLRFGSISETGYGNAALAQWFNYPLWLGLPKILFAAGKGILWFSPLLWMALPLALGRSVPRALRWLGLALFALPVLLFSSTLGWQSGQCWGARYVTPAVVALLAIVLPLVQPWRRWPRSFAVLCALGLLVNVTSVLAPTRGQNQLAGQATEAMYRLAFQRGEITRLDLDHLDHADHFFFLPRFSPLHSNWTYAWLSGAGEFEDARGEPRHGAGHTIVPMFGVDPAGVEPMPGRSPPEQLGHAPVRWEDRAFRHLWWRFWADLLDIGALWLALPWLLCTTWVLVPAVRAVSRN
jgi:hypothetical protein